jgi:2-polyprenyl-6-methoxyphenol hydroxylase-like FAD-dependent oxidoreductase
MIWWANLPREKEFSTEELAKLDWRVVQNEMLERYRKYYQPIPALITNTSALLRLNVFDIQSLPTWHRGRITLIGDAAHAVSPNAGQGASLALEDAIYLARLFRDTPGDFDGIFQRFERDRKSRVEKIVAEGRRRASDKEIVSPLRSKLREVLMMFFIRVWGEKSQDWILGHKIDWNGRATAAR